MAKLELTGHQYRDLVAAYVHHNFSDSGLVVYREVSLGKTIIGKDRRIDILCVREQEALAIECKYQDSQGTADEKMHYALEDLAALWMAGVLVYAGNGWSRGVLHQLEASRHAAACLPQRPDLRRTKATLELDYVIAATFGLWEKILPSSKRYRAPRP